MLKRGLEHSLLHLHTYTLCTPHNVSQNMAIIFVGLLPLTVLIVIESFSEPSIHRIERYTTLALLLRT